MFEFQRVLFLYWKSRICNLSGRKSLWIITFPASCYWCCDIVNIQQMEFISSPHQARDIAPSKLFIFQHLFFCLVLSSQHQPFQYNFIKKTKYFPFTGDHRCWRGLVFSSSPLRAPTEILLLNVLHSCWQSHIVLSHSHRSYWQK